MTSLAVGLLCLGLPVAAMTVGIVLVVRATQRAKERRRASMAAYAAQREWRFSTHAPALERRFGGDPFGRGSARTARNSVEGSYEGRHFVAFDYSYVTRSGERTQTSSFSVVAMHLGELGGPVPTLQVSPQTSLGRFFSGLFGTDLIIGHQGFDDAFHVRADSPELAHDVLHPGMVALLADFRDRAWRLQDDSLLMFRSGSHTPAEIDRVLWSMKAILDQVPEQVWLRLGRRR